MSESAPTTEKKGGALLTAQRLKRALVGAVGFGLVTGGIGALHSPENPLRGVAVGGGFGAIVGAILGFADMPLTKTPS